MKSFRIISLPRTSVRYGNAPHNQIRCAAFLAFLLCLLFNSHSYLTTAIFFHCNLTRWACEINLKRAKEKKILAVFTMELYYECFIFWMSWHSFSVSVHFTVFRWNYVFFFFWIISGSEENVSDFMRPTQKQIIIKWCA